MLGGLLLAVVALASAILTMRGAVHGDEVAVPNLSGMGLAEAEQKTAALGLGLDVENKFYSATVPEGRVMAQQPGAGSVVRREWHVRVAESLGAQRVAVPDVTGRQERAAALQIEKVGLELGSIARLNGAMETQDSVIAQSPTAATTEADGPRVSLLVSDGGAAPVAAYVMPDLTGLTYSVAVAMCERAGMKMGAAEFRVVTIPAVVMGAALTATRATTVPGMVMAQVPMAGERVKMGDTVKLTVAK